ncbi:hypothetical protein JVU11DRAFT_2955 [Chiua virens]|nr:hypothetical protein JVU11DRAFT_2955 [Chiua virens]
MTHSYFVTNGGLVFCDNLGFEEIDAGTFLKLLDADELVNPAITEADIKDKSHIDGLAIAILIVQLSWFTIQVVTRLANHLAVTLLCQWLNQTLCVR